MTSGDKPALRHREPADESRHRRWTGGRGVLDGAFRILQALPDTGRSHQHTQLARITGIPRSSVYRLLAQLEAVGAVERLNDGRYVAAPLLAEIARGSDPHAAVREKGLQMMQALRSRTGATISLVVPQRQGYVALEVLPGQVPLATPIYSGIEMPGASAGALVFDPSAAPQRVAPVNGWAYDDARVYSGLTCYASAIRVDGRTAAALQISTPVETPSNRFANLIRRAADEVARQLSA